MEKVACTLNSGQLGERRQRWLELGGRAFAARTETPDGLGLEFANEAGVEAELRELAELERECCAFASWSVVAVNGRAVLDVTSASDDGVAALHAMFRALPSERPLGAG